MDVIKRMEDGRRREAGIRICIYIGQINIRRPLWPSSCQIRTIQMELIGSNLLNDLRIYNKNLAAEYVFSASSKAVLKNQSKENKCVLKLKIVL